MRGFLAVGCMGLSMLVGAACSAAAAESNAANLPGAMVNTTAGSVSVDQGQGFQSAGGAVEAKLGDRVMVSPEGSGSITYADGCTVNLKPGAVVTITSLSPCASGSYAQDYTNVGGVMIAILGGTAIGTTIYFIDKNNTAPPPAPASP